MLAPVSSSQFSSSQFALPVPQHWRAQEPGARSQQPGAKKRQVTVPSPDPLSLCDDSPTAE